MRRMGYMILGFVLFLSGAALTAEDWANRNPVQNPGQRSQNGMCYVGSDRVLVFGGLVSSVRNDETWGYDVGSNNWYKRNPPSKPSAREGHAMAWVGSDRALLFGGTDGSYKNDTWVYDYGDNSWISMIPYNPKPSARIATAMAFIGGTKALLFGGRDSGGLDDETWVYDWSLNSWTQLSPTSKPLPREWHDMAYIGGDRVMLFGGDATGLNSETWVFDLGDNAWTQKSPSSHPSARMKHKMAYMGEDKVMLFGGDDGSTNGQSWVYDLSADLWVQDFNGSNPSPRFAHGMAETSMDGSRFLVLYGGTTSSGDNGETWTFGGGDYSLPVELSLFSAQTGDGQVTLLWKTESEIDCAGFNLYRSSTREGENVRVNPRLIAATGSSLQAQTYQYTDKSVSNGQIYYYQLEDLNTGGATSLHGPVVAKPMVAPSALLPEEYALQPNFPNPFNPGTTLPYDLPTDCQVDLAVYTLLGTRVRTLVNGEQDAGFHSVYWNGTNEQGADLPSGVYLVQLKTEQNSKLRKITLIK